MREELILRQLNLLLVDDNHQVHARLYSLFSPIFKSVILAQNAEKAMERFSDSDVDIIITDIEMPGTDGLSLIENIRAADTFIPIIVLSAHSDKEYLLRASNLQVDGYIVKPVNFRKLQVALNRSIRRLEDRIKPVQISKAVSYHSLYKSLRVDEEEVSLGKKECLLLELLLVNAHRVVSKQEIHEAVWPEEIVSESALKNLLGELRRKLKYNVIKNRHGLGWSLSGMEE